MIDGIINAMKVALISSIFVLFYWANFGPESFGAAAGRWYVKYHQGFTIGLTEKD